MNPESSDLADDVVPDDLPEHLTPQPRRREFKPWHKVRKQYIRERQWNWFTTKLVKNDLRNRLQDEQSEWSLDDDIPEDEALDSIPDEILVERPLSCLTIPGDDLLDLRSLWNDLEPYGCYMRYLGFNSGQGSNRTDTQVHVANNAVRSLPRVAKNSLVIHGPFQSLASKNSQSYRYLAEYGPFHIVNLDLCDSLFPTAGNKLTEYLKAIFNLTAFQMQNQKAPWLLFITTQVCPREVDVATLDQLCGPIRKNCSTHARFEEELCGVVADDAFTESKTTDIGGLTEESMASLFGVAFGKTLLAYANSSTQHWKVRMLTSHKYVLRADRGVSMFSLAYELRPVFVPPIDPTGIASAESAVAQVFDELSLALKIIEGVRKISDVDEELANSRELFEELRERSANLLEKAGFDREAYLKWVADGEVTGGEG